MMDLKGYVHDCQLKWRRRVLSGCICASVVMFVMNCALIYAFKRRDGMFVKGEPLFLKTMLHLCGMGAVDAVATFAAYRIGHLNVKDAAKNYAVMIALVVILALGSLSHEYMYISLLFPCLAILIASPFGDMKLLNVTGAITIATSLTSCILWASRADTSALIKGSVILGVVGSVLVFYFFALSMLIVMCEQMEAVIEGWADQERLVAELRLEPLTRLYNRTAFQEAVLASMSAFRNGGHAVSLAFIDLDNFKSVNDTYGHASGDAVLMAFAELMTSVLGSNRNVFRYGGDEFAALFKDVPLEDVRETMDTVREHYANMKFDFISREVNVSASIGIAAYQEGMTSREWITAADDAAYAAKNAGKNSVVLAGSMPKCINGGSGAIYRNTANGQ